MNLRLKHLIVLLLVPFEVNIYSSGSNSSFALSWITTGLLTGGIGTGSYLYSSYKPKPESDFFYNLEENDKGPITIFVHGYEDSHQQAYQYVGSAKINGIYYNNPYSIITTPSLATFNFADAGQNKLRLNRKESSLAQHNELATLFRVMQKITRKHPTRDIVLVGLSRGASTIINFLAFCPQFKIKAVVLESPFGHLRDIITNFVSMLGLERIPGINDIGMMLAQSLFPLFDKNSIHPIDLVSEITQYIPILIVASSEDKLVPISSSHSLYEKLVVSNHQNVYFLRVKHGKHAAILSGKSAQLYQDVVHAFYNKFGLPSNPEFVNRGQKYLNKPQLQNIQLKENKKFHYF